MEKAIIRVELLEMPMDKFSNNQHIHATGYRCKLSNGDWWTEYQDEIYEDSDDCKYLYEHEDGEYIEILNI